MTTNEARAFLEGEDGHWQSGLAATVAGAGAVALGIGAASDTGWLAVVGGIVAGVGLLAYDVVRHMVLDYDTFRRLGRLEKPGKPTD